LDVLSDQVLQGLVWLGVANKSPRSWSVIAVVSWAKLNSATRPEGSRELVGCSVYREAKKLQDEFV
jgi:hypothetical protein